MRQYDSSVMYSLFNNHIRAVKTSILTGFSFPITSAWTSFHNL